MGIRRMMWGMVRLRRKRMNDKQIKETDQQPIDYLRVEGIELSSLSSTIPELAGVVIELLKDEGVKNYLDIEKVKKKMKSNMIG